jgi:hypothetical protein
MDPTMGTSSKKPKLISDGLSNGEITIDFYSIIFPDIGLKVGLAESVKVTVIKISLEI